MTSSTPLHRRLCEYYLDCIARDDAGGVSVPARQGAEPAYVELPKVALDAGRLSPDEKLADFVSPRRPRDSGTLRLGYPVLAARAKWEGAPRKLTPLFLIDLSVDDKGIEPEWDTCALNLEALRELEGHEIHFAQHTMLELEEGLGLLAPGAPKAFAPILERLKLLRPEWPWAEGSELSNKPLREVQPGLIYPRGLVFRVQRPYTQGLELELQRLSRVPESQLRGTALGTLLFGAQPTPAEEASDMPLLEVLPMNVEQRLAVRVALNEPIATITGPPGTGKSQVVANLLINCAWQRHTTLFTSKNHKAVDVVHERVNALGAKPIMVRLGAKEHRHKLAEHLTFLLNGEVAPESIERLRRENAAYERIAQAFDEVAEAECGVIDAHARHDALSRELASGGTAARGLPLNEEATGAERAQELLGRARDALLWAQPNLHPWWMRSTWTLWRAKHELALERALGALSAHLGSLGPAYPAPHFRLEDAPRWKRYLLDCAQAIGSLDRLREQAASLRHLRDVDLGALAARRNALQGALVETSMRLWQAWVATQPAQLSREQREALAHFGDILKSILEASEGESLPPDIRREYERLTLKAPEVVSCFALTTLSARNRVPFVPGYFDLVVFDESSQCDLASALPILFRAKRAVIIGDPKQLRHISGLRRERDVAFLAQHQLSAHPAWQYSTQSLFDLAHARVRRQGAVSLREHYRSHPDVVGFSNQAFYAGALRVLTRLPDLKRSEKGPAVRWIDVAGNASRGQSGSVCNPSEVRAVAEEVQRLLASGYTGTIGVVTPFAHQAEKIRRELERDRALWERLRRDHDFQSATAHGFQGDERDLMVFSIVAAPGLHAGAQRFLETERHVFNVALTRARAELCVVGHLTWCRSAPISHLREFARYVSALTSGAGAAGAPQGASAVTRLPPHIERLRAALEAEGINARAHVQIEQYQVDLAVQSGADALAIDVPQVEPASDACFDTLQSEQLKRQRLLKLGWDVLCFWPIQLEKDLPWCLKRVKDWCETHRPTRPVSEGGEAQATEDHTAADFVI